MARSVDLINLQVTTQLQTSFASVGITLDITNWSKRNILRLCCYAFSVCAAYIEQMMDDMKLSIETTASKTPAASRLWIQSKMFLFQYSSTIPQIIQLINGIPQYPTVDPTLTLITACSVDSNISNEVIVKVAKGTSGSLTNLTSLELSAAQTYLNTIGDAAVQYQVISQSPDLVYIAADIFYNGQLSVQNNVINALNSFLQNLSLTNFDGSIRVSDLEGVIKGVTGVNDVVLKTVLLRPTGTTYPSGIYMVQNSTVLLRQSKTAAGYAIGETSTGNTFNDSLHFVSE